MARPPAPPDPPPNMELEAPPVAPNPLLEVERPPEDPLDRPPADEPPVDREPLPPPKRELCWPMQVAGAARANEKKRAEEVVRRRMISL